MAVTPKADWRTSIGRTLAVFVLFSFLFHFAWEILQAPLFARMPMVSHWLATLVCLKATFGDVGIALASFAVGAWWERDWRWFVMPSNSALAAYLATGVLITIVFELYAVYWAGRWSYSELMPIVPLLRVGLAPLLQWIALPLAVLFFVRCHQPRRGTRWL
jgi:hypothetical protein